MAEQGWMGVEVPEDEGGLGLGFVDAAVRLEQVGRHTAPAPFLHSLLAISALSGTPWVERLVAGDAVGCVAWSPVRAEGGRLTGRSEPVPYAPVADVAVVTADDGVYAVDLAEAGRPAAEPAMDLTRTLGWLVFDGTPATRIGDAAAAGALLD